MTYNGYEFPRDTLLFGALFGENIPNDIKELQNDHNLFNRYSFLNPGWYTSDERQKQRRKGQEVGQLLPCQNNKILRISRYGDLTTDVTWIRALLEN
jgi:hypothetical protein